MIGSHPRGLRASNPGIDNWELNWGKVEVETGIYTTRRRATEDVGGRWQAVTAYDGLWRVMMCLDPG